MSIENYNGVRSVINETLLPPQAPATTRDSIFIYGTAKSGEPGKPILGNDNTVELIYGTVPLDTNSFNTSLVRGYYEVKRSLNQNTDIYLVRVGDARPAKIVLYENTSNLSGDLSYSLTETGKPVMSIQITSLIDGNEYNDAKVEILGIMNDDGTRGLEPSLMEITLPDGSNGTFNLNVNPNIPGVISRVSDLVSRINNYPDFFGKIRASFVPLEKELDITIESEGFGPLAKKKRIYDIDPTLMGYVGTNKSWGDKILAITKVLKYENMSFTVPAGSMVAELPEPIIKKDGDLTQLIDDFKYSYENVGLFNVDPIMANIGTYSGTHDLPHAHIAGANAPVDIRELVIFKRVNGGNPIIIDRGTREVTIVNNNQVEVDATLYAAALVGDLVELIYHDGTKVEYTITAKSDNKLTLDGTISKVDDLLSTVETDIEKTISRLEAIITTEQASYRFDVLMAFDSNILSIENIEKDNAGVWDVTADDIAGLTGQLTNDLIVGTVDFTVLAGSATIQLSANSITAATELDSYVEPVVLTYDDGGGDKDYRITFSGIAFEATELPISLVEVDDGTGYVPLADYTVIDAQTVDVNTPGGIITYTIDYAGSRLTGAAIITQALFLDSKKETMVPVERAEVIEDKVVVYRLVADFTNQYGVSTIPFTLFRTVTGDMETQVMADFSDLDLDFSAQTIDSVLIPDGPVSFQINTSDELEINSTTMPLVEFIGSISDDFSILHNNVPVYDYATMDRKAIRFTNIPVTNGERYFVTYLCPVNYAESKVRSGLVKGDQRSFFIFDNQIIFGAEQPANLVVNYGTDIYLETSSVRILDSNSSIIELMAGETELPAIGEKLYIGFQYEPELPSTTGAVLSDGSLQFGSFSGGSDGRILDGNSFIRAVDKAMGMTNIYPRRRNVVMGIFMDDVVKRPNFETGVMEDQPLNAGLTLARKINEISFMSQECTLPVPVTPLTDLSQVSINSWLDRLINFSNTDVSRPANIIEGYDNYRLDVPVCTAVLSIPEINNGRPYYAYPGSLLVAAQENKPLAESLINIPVPGSVMKVSVPIFSADIIGSLNAKRYTTMVVDAQERTVWSDAPTVARRNSVFASQMVREITFRAISLARVACNPFIGKPMSPQYLIPMEKAVARAIDEDLGRTQIIKDAYIKVKNDGNSKITGGTKLILMFTTYRELKVVQIETSVELG